MSENKFIEELEKINITLDSKQLNQFQMYYNLLIEWNQKMNLTGIVEIEQVYLKHFYDSLTICKIINLNDVKSICDVGSGAGFPGLVLKIVFPHLDITLVDSLNKRITFLNHIIDTLDLQNIKAIHSRIEEYGKENREKYDVVTARAVAPLNILMEYCVPLVKEQKYFIPLKANVEDELISCQNAFKQLDVSLEEKINFSLVIENSQRTILKFKKIKKTKQIFPRKYAEIKRKPL